MHLDVDEGTVILEPFVGMTRVAVLVVVAVGSSTVREENHHLMDRLWVLGEIVLSSSEEKISIMTDISKYDPHLTQNASGSFK